MCICKHVCVQRRNVKNKAKNRNDVTIKWKTLLLDPLFDDDDDKWKYIFWKYLCLNI